MWWQWEVGWEELLLLYYFPPKKVSEWNQLLNWWPTSSQHLHAVLGMGVRGRKPPFLHIIYFLCPPELWDLNLSLALMALVLGLFVLVFVEIPDWGLFARMASGWVPWVIVRPSRSKKYNISVEGAGPNHNVMLYWNVHVWVCLLLCQLQGLPPKRELGWFNGTEELRIKGVLCFHFVPSSCWGNWVSVGEYSQLTQVKVMHIVLISMKMGRSRKW